MRTIRFRCKDCYQEFEAPASDNGAAVTCNCGRKLVIPKNNRQTTAGIIFMIMAIISGFATTYVNKYTPQNAGGFAALTTLLFLISVAALWFIILPHLPKIVLAIGVAGIGIFLFLNLMIGVVAAGFIAVIGTILLLKPKSAHS